jgi:hypothetical protein
MADGLPLDADASTNLTIMGISIVGHLFPLE